jgi:transposase
VIDFLSQMLTHHRRRHLVVVMDNAPPHVSKKTLAYIEGQPRLHVFNLPTYMTRQRLDIHRASPLRRSLRDKAGLRVFA